MQEKPDFRIAVVVGVTLAFLIAIGNLYWQVEHIRADEIVTWNEECAVPLWSLPELQHKIADAFKKVLGK